MISLIMLLKSSGNDPSQMLMHISFHIWTNLSSLPRWFSKTLARVKMAISSCVSMRESMIMAYPQTIVPPFSSESLEVCSCARMFLNTSSVPSYTTSLGFPFFWFAIELMKLLYREVMDSRDVMIWMWILCHLFPMGGITLHHLLLLLLLLLLHKLDTFFTWLFFRE